MVSLILLSFLSMAQIKIAVLDSGLNNPNDVRLCEDRIDFTNSYSLKDEYDHGTNISNIIEEGTKGANVCQYSLKIFNKNANLDSVGASVRALKYALKKKVNIVNYSGGGVFYDEQEKIIIKKLLDSGVTFIAAAGNANEDLDKNCNFFPACYDPRIIVVGSVMASGEKSRFSNYGKTVKVWAVGHSVVGHGISMTGTSQATALITATLIRSIPKRKIMSVEEEQEARAKLAEAMSKQFKVDAYVSKKFTGLVELLPASLKPYVKYLVVGTDVITKQKVEIKYEF